MYDLTQDSLLNLFPYTCNTVNYGGCAGLLKIYTTIAASLYLGFFKIISLSFDLPEIICK